ncbi:hypothetical protein BK816_04015 [Boudabousia tangfeifanii]|uniref:Thioesterase domain-containing protein n=1 Tax=Boudabousia tangfeifanii TaxID=1912795 RepID=A0A1D9MK52_9ACTO|nr:PaaI family thioesterase [Boudabousia tangfeifanii]AOZ72563.1 hypothetical protein BK816_04015 [Boudabousia tangfeifanii]
MIEFQPLDPTNQIPTCDLHERMGIEVISWSAEHTVMTMPISPNVQPYGLLHGGAILLLAEAGASLAANAHAHKLNCVAVGTNVSGSHLKSARGDFVTASCQAVHLGRTSATYDVRVTDQEERLVSIVQVTCRLLAQ